MPGKPLGVALRFDRRVTIQRRFFFATPTGYRLLCVGLGLPLGCLPMLLHGPIPAKFDRYYIDGSIAVWAFYTARLLIGFWVGIGVWPRRWWLRGPLCGFFSVFAVTFFSLATPSCGPKCMFWNLVTGSAVGFGIGGLAYLISRHHHA
jgi:hypothetical protein